MKKNTYVQFENTFFERIINQKRMEMFKLVCKKINISKINDKTLQELENYMKYVIQQEEQLNEIEEQKQYLSKEYFDNKTHKDNSL